MPPVWVLLMHRPQAPVPQTAFMPWGAHFFPSFGWFRTGALRAPRSRVRWLANAETLAGAARKRAEPAPGQQKLASRLTGRTLAAQRQ